MNSFWDYLCVASFGLFGLFLLGCLVERLLPPSRLKGWWLDNALYFPGAGAVIGGLTLVCGNLAGSYESGAGVGLVALLIGINILYQQITVAIALEHLRRRINKPLNPPGEPDTKKPDDLEQ